jgi:hypothetical protein
VEESGDPYYGAPGSQDLTWEVFCGRFPVRNATHLANMINKTIVYSEKPVADVKRLFLAESKGKYLGEYIGTCNANGYTTNGFLQNEWDIKKFYGDSTGQWDAVQFRAALASHKPTFLMYCGHGNPTYVWGESPSNVTTTNYPQDGAANGSNIVAITLASLCGDFNEATDCIMETFSRLSTGLVASISNSNSVLGDNDGTNSAQQRCFRYSIDALFNPDKKMHHLEAVHAHGKEMQANLILNTDCNTPPYYYSNAYAVYGTNLMGDPALSIWSRNPQTLIPVILNPVATTYFEWNSGLAYTWVALCDGAGKIFAAQLTGKDGKCKIDNAIVKKYLEENDGKQLTVRIKAHNYLPYEGKFDIKIGTGINNGAHHHFSIVAGRNNTSKIILFLNKSSKVNIALYSVKGSLIKTLVNGNLNAGAFSVPINTGSQGAGIFYCRFIINGVQGVQKFSVIR